MVPPSHHHRVLVQTSLHWAVILSPHPTVLVRLVLFKPRALSLSVT